MLWLQAVPVFILYELHFKVSYLTIEQFYTHLPVKVAKNDVMTIL